MCVSLDFVFSLYPDGIHGKQRDKEVVDAGILQSTFAGLGERCTCEISDDLV